MQYSDFAERTVENYHYLENSKYDMTQLINSSVALLIVPEQWYFEKITDNLNTELPFEELKKQIIRNKYSEDADSQSICRHMRNAVSHGYIYPQYEKGVIKSIKLCDSPKDHNARKNPDNHYFIIDIPILLLRDFYLKFTSVLTNEKLKRGK